ncbi:Polynucleotide 5'-hydroxyl-kinase grc3 [Fusarium torreyae]|uniref:Polynucleotide 5'-hydroxyl-kinase GRC3 n=1 Tax=Fusarium torreyae TaxID=1237075 RepID=A0A9W8VQ98_9HYPO|nr:Polynucleotide 5'-hydroxyl-kinase grc3 [Fusarium torreyae]
MSSHKKRRIDGIDAPKPMSAISALAARRREAAASPTPTTQQPSETDEKPIVTNTNYFSPLQKSNSQNRTSSAPKKSAVKAPRPQRGTESPRPQPKASGSISERFLIIGSFGVRIIQGELTLAGATLRPSETIEWVHAPHCHAVPVLRTTEDARLELHPDQNARGLRQLGRISPLFRKMWNEPPEGDSAKKISKEATFQIIHTSEDAPKKCIIQDLVSPPAWNRKLASLIMTSRKKPSLTTLVCGPKSSGKSTFSRLFLNRLLTDQSQSQTTRSVVVLDLDPGQPEYAPAGTLSLVAVTRPNLGTPFTHPGFHKSAFKIIRCHSMASVTPASDPDLYLACAADLLETYSKNFDGVPLIINTPGWILGTGLDLLSELTEKTKPDEVLYMSEEGPSETVDALRTATETTFTELPSQQSEFTSRTAAHLRAMQSMSYFHLQEATSKSLESSDTPPRGKWNASPLSLKSPLLVQYSSPKRGVLGLISYDYQCPPELLADTVNGLVLAAVEIEDAKAFSGFTQEKTSAEVASATMKLDSGDKCEPPQLVSTSPEAIPFIPNYNDAALDPRYSRTIGLVLLRGIDTKSKTLQLITPIPVEEFKHIKSQGRHIVLLHGKFDAPSWAYTEDLYEKAGTDDGNDTILQITDEDTEDDQSDAEPEEVDRVSDLTEVPWVEVLKGNQRRPVGSRVWRVRRDLGRNNTGD